MLENIEIHELLPALQLGTTFLVAIVAASIAYQQYIISREKLRLELFDRRMEAYKKLTGFISRIATDGNIDFANALQFYRETADMVFLFKKEVVSYREDIYKNAVRLARLTEKHPCGLSESESNEEEEIVNYFLKQFDMARLIFGRYLRIKKV